MTHEWRRKRGWLNRTGEKLTELPVNLVARKGALTVSRKRELYEKGIIGQATILKAPGKHAISPERGGAARYTVRVELPGREPYEVKTWQDVAGWEWRAMPEGAEVEVRVDPEDNERLVLCLPEGEVVEKKRPSGYVDSSDILAKGRRAVATIRHSEEMEGDIPGTDDKPYLLELELRAESERKPWRVQIGQRVPRGAQELIAGGRELTVAYLEKDDGDTVAVDWPATTGGRFS